MKKLLTLLLLLGIVGCEQEPSLLDKCIAFNIKDIGKVDILNTWPTYDRYKKIKWDSHFEDLRQGDMGWPTFYQFYIDKDFVYKSYTEDERSWMLLTKSQQQNYEAIFTEIVTIWSIDRKNVISEQSYEELTEVVKTLNANSTKLNKLKAENICNMQGIY